MQAIVQTTQEREQMKESFKADFFATQGGGYAYYDEDSQRHVFVQTPTGDYGFKVGDSVPEEWGLTSAIGVIIFYESGGKQMNFFVGCRICPYCRRHVEKCDCSDADICPNMEARG